MKIRYINIPPILFYFKSNFLTSVIIGQTIAMPISELLATYLLRKLKWELLGKNVLLLATFIYQARRASPCPEGFFSQPTSED